MLLSMGTVAFADETQETYKSVLFNYAKADTATKVGDVLNFKAEDVERFHIGKVTEEQFTVVVDISAPDDRKKLYNNFASLEFTDNSDVEDEVKTYETAEEILNKLTELIEIIDMKTALEQIQDAKDKNNSLYWILNKISNR